MDDKYFSVCGTNNGEMCLFIKPDNHATGAVGNTEVKAMNAEIEPQLLGLTHWLRPHS